MLNFKKKLFIGIDLGSNTLRICAMDESLNIFLSDEIVTGVARGLKAGDALNLKAKDLIINSLLKFKLILRKTIIALLQQRLFVLHEIVMNFSLKFLQKLL